MLRSDWQSVWRDLAAVGPDTYAEFGTSPVLRKVLHDLRGGPMTSLAIDLGFIYWTKERRRPARVFLLARDVCKIMRNSFPDLDPNATRRIRKSRRTPWTYSSRNGNEYNTSIRLKSARTLAVRLRKHASNSPHWTVSYITWSITHSERPPPMVMPFVFISPGENSTLSPCSLYHLQHTDPGPRSSPKRRFGDQPSDYSPRIIRRPARG